jgi:hypothetical protein
MNLTIQQIDFLLSLMGVGKESGIRPGGNFTALQALNLQRTLEHERDLLSPKPNAAGNPANSA